MELQEPRPLVHRRVGMRQCKEESDDLLSILKTQIIHDGLEAHLDAHALLPCEVRR